MKTHPLNVSYLVVGLIFLGLSGWWALKQTGVIELGSAEWMLPLTLVVAGGVGLAATAAKALRSDKAGPAKDAYQDDYDADYTPDYTSDIEEKLK